MLDFHPLQLEDLPKLRNFFQYSGSRVCDTTPGTVFIWRDLYKTEWAVYDGSLYFKVDYPGLGPTFTLPLGGGRPEHYRQIADYCCRRNMPIAFTPVPRDELDRLQEAFPNSAAIANRDAFDYLYRAEDLKFFRGKKLSGQRNHVNKFLKTYGTWSFRVITPEDVPQVEAFLDRYAAGRDKASASFHEDLAKAREVLDTTRDPQLSDIVLDRWMYRDMAQVAEDTGSQFLRGYVETQIDAANLRALIRTLRMGKNADFLAGVLFESGTMEPAAILAAANHPAGGLNEIYGPTRFAQAAEAGEAALKGGSLTEFEKRCDDAVSDYLAGAQMIPFGEAPLLAYLAARETEYTNIRILLMGRAAGLSPEVIRSRLRRTCA